MRHIFRDACSGWPAPITVVSGLPRSGTSLLMQMLQAGGMKLLVDRVRPVDDHNPKGYFEYEPVKRLKEDASWLPLAQGKAIKIISHFLEFLPNDCQYNVIFMRRDLGELLASQRSMLDDYKREAEVLPDNDMKYLFRKHLTHIENYLHTHSCFKILYLDYHEILENPHDVAVDIEYFLGGGLDVSAMTQVVDPGLYRNRV